MNQSAPNKLYALILQAQQVIQPYPNVDYSEALLFTDDPEPLASGEYEAARLKILRDATSDDGVWNQLGVENERSAEEILEELETTCIALRADRDS